MQKKSNIVNVLQILLPDHAPLARVEFGLLKTSSIPVLEGNFEVAHIELGQAQLQRLVRVRVLLVIKFVELAIPGLVFAAIFLAVRLPRMKRPSSETRLAIWPSRIRSHGTQCSSLPVFT